MQQRVGLARALAGDPELLLMDEPFGALDPLIRRQLQDQFLSLSRVMRKTTIFITHDLDEAIRLGTRIAIMRDGQLVQIGTPAEIVRKPADDYVADFVSGLSRLKLLRASDIMTPLAGHESRRSSHPGRGRGPTAISTSWSISRRSMTSPSSSQRMTASRSASSTRRRCCAASRESPAMVDRSLDRRRQRQHPKSAASISPRH